MGLVCMTHLNMKSHLKMILMKKLILQVAYKKLFKECTQLKKLNKRTFKKLNEVELEKENLLAKLDDLHALFDKLKHENIVLNEQIKSLDNELEESKHHLKKTLVISLIKC